VLGERRCDLLDAASSALVDYAQWDGKLPAPVGGRLIVIINASPTPGHFMGRDLRFRPRPHHVRHGRGREPLLGSHGAPDELHLRHDGGQQPGRWAWPQAQPAAPAGHRPVVAASLHEARMVTADQHGSCSIVPQTEPGLF